MMFSRLGVLNAFSTYDIFDLQWGYQDIVNPRSICLGSVVLC